MLFDTSINLDIPAEIQIKPVGYICEKAHVKVLELKGY
jgi:hypothetical protein